MSKERNISGESELRYCTPAESLKQALKEMKLMREGKLPKKPWDEFYKEIKEWKEEEGL
ncbi:hypothetical protein [Aneurinibacillus soli]|uniref:hypothetical protein n=1 Tax=Aneurinibacillus soli TaxID=1500254 RepID=UPI0012FD69BA|nr:hypothetical protein [Aneurinibacillus soli]